MIPGQHTADFILNRQRSTPSCPSHCRDLELQFHQRVLLPERSKVGTDMLFGRPSIPDKLFYLLAYRILLLGLPEWFGLAGRVATIAKPTNTSTSSTTDLGAGVAGALNRASAIYSSMLHCIRETR